MSGYRTITALLLSVALLLSADAIPAQSTDGETFSVPVRQLTLVSQSTDEEMAPSDGAIPTLPGGKLPQYRLHGGGAPEVDPPADRPLRFLLTLPTEPLLIDIMITIDGKPFQQVREERIEELLAQLEQPVVEEPALPAETVQDTDEPDAPATSETETSDSEEESSADAEAEEPVVPEVAEPTIPPYRLPATVLERLRRQRELLGEMPSPEELRWILRNWVDGPVVLFLKRNFQRFRAGQQPLVDVLDRDRDGAISADELANAVASIEECDLNRNDNVDVAEIERSAKDPRRQRVRGSQPAPVLLAVPGHGDARRFWDQVVEACASINSAGGATQLRFDTDGDGLLGSEEWDELRSKPSDVLVTVAFDTVDPEASRLTIATKRNVSAAATGPGVSPDDVVRVLVNGSVLEFSAVQGSATDQVSIGSVQDGYPLLASIDPNDDGRLTIRERRTLIDRLRTFDRNGDGVLSKDELQAPFRICVGLGPVVHRELAELRRVRPQTTTESPAAPGWFVRMDRNRDQDLSRAEFPGTNEQFESLDADRDSLISVEEALKASPSN